MSTSLIDTPAVLVSEPKIGMKFTVAFQSENFILNGLLSIRPEGLFISGMSIAKADLVKSGYKI